MRAATLLLAVGALCALPASASAAVQTHVLRHGPIDVGGYGVVRGGVPVATPGIDGHITRMSVRVVSADGTPFSLAHVMPHHIVFASRGANGERRDATCPERPIAQRFYGTSEELREMTLPEGHGYPLGARDRWDMVFMLMNHTHRAATAYIEYRVTVDDAPGYTPVTPYWVSVVPCTPDPQYTVPGGGGAGSLHRREIDWTVPASGRIVAMGGHQHGGAVALTLSQPRCDGRELFSSLPGYGSPNHPVYRVKPLLHEPDPIEMGWLQSQTGIPVVAGETLRLASVYDAERPHMRVMGIMHVYVAPDGADPAACAPPPGDALMLGGTSARLVPPSVALTLAQVFPNGRARAIDRPQGRLRRFRADGRVEVDGFAFRPANVALPAGSTLIWRFSDRSMHDATTVSGPRGFASPTQNGGRTFRYRFGVPGTYRFHCSIHPAVMAGTVEVERSARR